MLEGDLSPTRSRAAKRYLLCDSSSTGGVFETCTNNVVTDYRCMTAIRK